MTFKSRALGAASFAVLAAISLSTEAFAQAGETEALAVYRPDKGSMTIETVVVTAQKREQNPIDVPIALTSYSGDFLKSVGVQEFDKLSLLVPGFEVQDQSPNNPGFVMRGITSDSGEATQEPRVSVFEDGVSISKSRGSYVELFDVDRIEVAKGPQSTLFGRGALIGAVNVIENKADPNAFAAALSGEAGSYDYYLLDGMVNVPVTDDFAVRFAGQYKARDGYIKNLIGGPNLDSTNTGAGRLSFAWKPSEAFSADLILNYEDNSPTGTSFKSGTFEPTNPTTGAVLGDLNHYTGAALSTAPGFENNKPLGITRIVEGAKLLLTDKITDATTLSSITAERRFHSEEVFDPDGFSLPLAVFAEDARGDQFSQELRINHDEGGAFSWFAGASYFFEDGSQRVPLQLDENILLGLLTGQITKPTPQPTGFFDSTTFTAGYAPALLQGLSQALTKGTYVIPLAIAQGIAKNLQTAHQEQYTNFDKTNSFDFYGDATWHATEKLEFEAGLRYTHDDKTTYYSSSTSTRSIIGGVIGALSEPAAVRSALLAGLATPGAASLTSIPDTLLPNFGMASQPTAGNGSKIGQSYSDEGLTWRATARYALEPETSLYATYATGRRPEVLAVASPAAPYGAPVFTPVAAETVNSYEAGAKTLTLDGKLRLDGAIYYYTYTNFQTTVLQGVQFITTNAGKADAYGFEGSADWAAAAWADLFATYTYSHARFAGNSIYKGNQFRLTPDNKLSIGASLRQTAFGGLFTLLPVYTWQSKIFFDDDNNTPSERGTGILPDLATDEYQNAYGLLNARLTYQPEGTRWNVGVFVTNALDQKYLKDAGNTGSDFGIPTYISGEPRFYGFSFSFKTQ